MDEPKTPDDARDWDSINIFLFTNGQDYSPPRKYHLKTEEIKCWNSILNLLAHSQFGSLQSNIELYTLDGKKINTPLELKNDAAYVAVKPPDTFVQTGYGKYLLKASRSWEKRHERLNNTEIAKSERENSEMNRKQFKPNLDIPNDGTINEEKNIDGLSLDANTEYFAKVQNTTSQSQKDNAYLSFQPTETTNNCIKTAKQEQLQIKKPASYTKNTTLKKIYPYTKSKDDGHNFNKKRTTSLPKDLIKSDNSKRLPISSNNTNILEKNLEFKSKVKLKEEPQINNIKFTENITTTKEKTEILRNDPVMKIQASDTSAKDFGVLSDVYENAESDVQSIFLDADRKTALLSNEQRKIPRTLENIEELRDNPESSLKTNTANSRQNTDNLSEIKASYNANQSETLNINLNIDLNGYTIFKTEDRSQANKYKTVNVSLKKLEKASQVNVNVSLSRDVLDSGRRVLLREQSAESGIAKPCKEKIADNKTKVTVHCKCCGNLTKSNSSSPCCFKEDDHYIIVIPAEKIDQVMTGSDMEMRRGSDKEIQELLHSYIRIPVSSNSQIVPNKKLDNVMKHKVFISQDARKEFNSDSMQLKSQGDIKQNTPINNNTIQLNYKIDNFAQTAWCNTLLQAKCHEDGRYTFHLPPLELLTQYNLL